jgi:[acyl-carrier-protein] S-malonyltransferase
LAVSGGFHSPFMHEAARTLHSYAQTLAFQTPALPLYANASNEPYAQSEAASLLGRQVESPVRFTALVRRMQADGITDFIEVGAGKTLAGLIGKIGGAARIAGVEDAQTLAATLALFKEETPC